MEAFGGRRWFPRAKGGGRGGATFPKNRGDLQPKGPTGQMSGEGTEFPSPPSRRAPPGWSAKAPYSGGGYVQHTKRCQASGHVRAVGRASGSGADRGGKGYEFFGAKYAKSALVFGGPGGGRGGRLPAGTRSAA